MGQRRAQPIQSVRIFLLLDAQPTETLNVRSLTSRNRGASIADYPLFLFRKPTRSASPH
jgi:hypothetical protein